MTVSIPFPIASSKKKGQFVHEIGIDLDGVDLRTPGEELPRQDALARTYLEDNTVAEINQIGDSADRFCIGQEVLILWSSHFEVKT
jgi:hypothetical protein